MESPFTSLTSSHYVPSKHEIEGIRNLLVEPLNQLSQIDTELAHLQSILDQLTLKRTRLHSDVLHHQNLISPLRRLPKEILQEIFIRCLPTDRNAAMSSHEAPLLLGRVCSQWRQVAISTPHLWSTIHITMGGGPVKFFPDKDSERRNLQLYERVKAWLDRSGSLPLSISVFEEPLRHSKPEDLMHLMYVLIEFSARWKNVCFILPRWTSPELYFITPESVPILESFSFHVKLVAYDLPPLDITTLQILKAPQLRRLSFSYPQTIPQSANWSQLTSLYLESCGNDEDSLTPTKAIEVLRNSSNLICCELNFTRASDTSPLDYLEVVKMPQLQTLRVWEGMIPIGEFLGLLRLPVLANLELTFSPPDVMVSGIEDDPEPSSSLIWTFLSRLNTLKELTLSSLNLTPTALLSYLEPVPSITRLSILGPWPLFPDILPEDMISPFKDEVAIRLTPNEDRPTLCPLLTVLECDPCDTSDAALLSLIQQRTTHALTHGVQPLERVNVIFHRASTMNILNELPPTVRAQTAVGLEYIVPKVEYKGVSPMAGLERPDRLRISRETSRHLYY